MTSTFLILLYFHDRFWFSRDDGYYAEIAARIIAGDVIHRDVQALHTGLIYFTNALALKLFGGDFISLRYPLIAAGVVQAILAYLILVPRGIVPAMVAGFAGASLSVVQFYNPTAHWYCVPIFFAIVMAVGPTGRAWRWRLEIIGALLATLFLYRQLTGVFVAIGVLTYLFLDTTEAERRDRQTCWLARTMIVVMAAGVFAYLSGKADPVAWLAFGIWPLLVLLRACFTVTMDNRHGATLLGRLAVGGAAAFMPLLVYHLATGSFGAWMTDSFFDAIALGEFSYQKTARYGLFALVALKQLGDPSRLGAFLNGLYWPVLIFATMALGIATIIRLYRQPLASAPSFGETGMALPFLGVFYGLVAVHYQDPAYLYFIAGVTAAALLWYGAGLRPPYRAALIAAVALQAATGLAFHAAQPISRSYASMLAGERVPVVKSNHAALAGLSMTASDKEALLALIDRYTKPDDAILAIPSNADLYFLSGRRNPLPYMFVPFGVRDDATTTQALKTLDADPPRLVFHVPALPYNTAHTNRIMDFVRTGYNHIATLREFVIYLRRD
ncbi:MAG: hypothetical protein O3C34_00550 [Proteobacteria bacterium]|nr:hypothetical protein [Pseudomonadota bacterium]